MPLAQGKVQLRAVFDQSSIDEIHATFAQALKTESIFLIAHLADQAVKQLSSMDAAAGHPFLSRQWDATSPQLNGNGTISADVFSHAEDLTLLNKSGATGSRSGARGQTWPVAGDKLLGWLEEGEKAHAITPRTATILAFRGAIGRSASNFAGTARFASGFAVAKFLGQSSGDLIRAARVNHPGFAGNRFLQATKQTIEEGLANETDAAARRIAVRVK